MPNMQGKGSKDLAWYSMVGAAVKGMSPTSGRDHGLVHPEGVGNVPDEPRQWRGFEFADALEQGLASGLPSTYTEPPSEVEGPSGSVAKEQRLVLQRSQNRLNYSLLDDAGRTLLVAKSSCEGLRFDVAGTQDGPDFALVATSAARDRWMLTSIRCDRCETRGRRQCGSRELLRLHHYVESVGEGQAFCMDVELPMREEDGSRAVLCEICRDGQGTAQWSTELTVRRPKWNPKHKSLTLDFHGRCSMASAKNFQLEDPSNPGKTKLLFGKVADNSFTLDYRHPLGMVQAFAAALSAAHWK